MNVDKYRELTRGMTTAVFNKLGGMSGAARFLAGEMTPQEFFRLSYEDDGVIYFSIFSFGRPVEILLERLKVKKFLLHDEEEIKAVVQTPTTGIMSSVAVIRADRFEQKGRNMRAVRGTAQALKFRPPTLELLLLTCDSSVDGKVLPSLSLSHLGAETAQGTFVVDKFGFNGEGRLQKVKLMCEDDDEIQSEAGFLYLVAQTPFETI